MKFKIFHVTLKNRKCLYLSDIFCLLKIFFPFYELIQYQPEPNEDTREGTHAMILFPKDIIFVIDNQNFFHLFVCCRLTKNKQKDDKKYSGSDVYNYVANEHTTD